MWHRLAHELIRPRERASNLQKLYTRAHREDGMMFPLAQPWQQALLLAALAVWAIFLFGGFLFGRRNAQETRRMPAWTRMASSLTLVVAAWLWYAFTRETSVGAYALLIGL